MNRGSKKDLVISVSIDFIDTMVALLYNKPIYTTVKFN
ncbi:MAG: hypothetical protein ACI8RH_000835 [Flavobacteriales bacterium]